MTARVATAVVGLPLVLVAAWQGSPFLSALVALAAAVAAVGLCNIAQARGARPGVWPYVGSSATTRSPADSRLQSTT